MERYFFLFSACVATVLKLFAPGKTCSPERILIIKLDHIGDVLTALPAIRIVRYKYPGVHLTLLCGTWVRELAERLMDVDEVMYYNSPRFSRSRDQNTTQNDIANVKKQIMKHGYDWIIQLRGDYRTLGWLLRLRPAKIIDRGAFRLHMWLRTKIRKNTQQILPEWQSNIAMIRASHPESAESVPQSTYIRIKPEDLVVPFSQELKQFPYILIQPGASWKYRQWSPDKFAYVINALGQHTKLPVVITDSVDHMEYVDEILNQTDYPVQNFTGRIRFVEWYQLMKRSALCIATDGAAVHLASLLNIPVIGLYGPEDPERWGPWSVQSRVFHVPVECFPCHQTECVVSENPCVNLISVDEVIQTALEMLYAAAAAQTKNGGGS